MHVKRFEAADMPEALRMVKQALGPNAIILSTRQIKKGGGAFGIFGRSFVEVTAAVDREAVEEPVSTPAAPPRAPAVSALRAYAPEAPDTARGFGPDLARLPGPDTARPSGSDMARALDPLQRDVEQMKDLLQQLTMKERLAPPVNLNGLEREFTAV